MSRVYLIGFMGSGKTTVGRLVAERLGLPFIDLDSELERVTKRSISQLFADSGETAFRAMERRALEDMARGPDAVIACGGGIVLDLFNRATLKETGTVVYLRVSAEEALDRIGSVSSRPVLAAAEDPRSYAVTLLSERAPLYESVADVTIDTRHQSPPGIAAAVAAALGALRAKGGAA